MQDIPVRNRKFIAQVGLYGSHAKGRKEYLAHLNGKKLSLKQAILAKCYDCTCYYADGREDCQMHHCPLHPHMHYNPEKTKRKATQKLAENLCKAASRRSQSKKK